MSAGFGNRNTTPRAQTRVGTPGPLGQIQPS